MFSAWVGWRRWKERWGVWSKVHKISWGYPISFSIPHPRVIIFVGVRQMRRWDGARSGGVRLGACVKWHLSGKHCGAISFQRSQTAHKNQVWCEFRQRAKGTFGARPPEKVADKRVTKKTHNVWDTYFSLMYSIQSLNITACRGKKCARVSSHGLWIICQRSGDPKPISRPSFLISLLISNTVTITSRLLTAYTLFIRGVIKGKPSPAITPAPCSRQAHAGPWIATSCEATRGNNG